MLLVVLAVLFTQSAQAIIGGTPLRDESLPGLVRFIDPPCSGVFINRNTILTAGHCLYSHGPDGRLIIQPGLEPGQTGYIEAYTPPENPDDPRSPAGRRFNVRIESITGHPHFLTVSSRIQRDEEILGMIHTSDLAVVKIRFAPSDTDAARRITPARISRHRVEAGDSVVMAGFGCRDPFESEAQRFYDPLAGLIARFGETVVSSFLGTRFVLPALAPAGTFLPISCPGDSGGPLFFRESVEDPWSVVGVIHAGIVQRSRLADITDPAIRAEMYSLVTRVDVPEIRRWIQGAAR